MAPVRIISYESCLRELGPWNAPELDSGMFCAVGESPGVDACPVSVAVTSCLQCKLLSEHFKCVLLMNNKMCGFVLQGDSGSGLVCIHDGRLTIVGITSYGLDCGVVGMPGVYTTPAYNSNIDFIHNVISGNL